MKNIILLLMFLLLSGCYKKDLDNLKNIKNSEITSEFAVPIFHSESTIHDSLNFISPFLFHDTINASFPSPKDIVKTSDFTIDSIQFKNIITTDIPVSFYFQVYLQDKNNNIIDSLFQESYYIENGLNTTIIYTNISQIKYQEFENSPNIKLYYYIKFNGGGTKSSYIINTEMGAKFKISYKI